MDGPRREDKEPCAFKKPFYILLRPLYRTNESDFTKWQVGVVLVLLSGTLVYFWTRETTAVETKKNKKN